MHRRGKATGMSEYSFSLRCNLWQSLTSLLVSVETGSEMASLAISDSSTDATAIVNSRTTKVPMYRCTNLSQVSSVMRMR